MSNKPLILITNDDGYMSPGLLAAAESVAELGDIVIVAPLEQQTAMSRALPKSPTVGIITTAELSVQGRPVTAYAVDGSPALAVSHAVLEICDRTPSLCISGINYGENLGLGLLNSGTIGAAYEADAYDIPSIAVSLQVDLSMQHSSDYEMLDWAAAGYFVNKLAAKVLASGLPRDVALLNVNVPAGASPSTPIRQTTQSRQQYFVYRKPVPRDRSQRFRFEVDIEIDRETLEPDSDIQALILDKCVSVMPLKWRMDSDADISHLYT